MHAPESGQEEPGVPARLPVGREHADRQGRGEDPQEDPEAVGDEVGAILRG